MFLRWWVDLYMNKYSFLITFLLGQLIFNSCDKKKNYQVVTVPEIVSQDAIQYIGNENYLFFDVRTVGEHNKIAIPNTPNIPIQELEDRIDELKIYRDRNIIVYCRSGNRSKAGTEILNNNGYNAVNLIGGMKQWNGPKISKN